MSIMLSMPKIAINVKIIVLLSATYLICLLYNLHKLESDEVLNMEWVISLLCIDA